MTTSFSTKKICTWNTHTQNQNPWAWSPSLWIMINLQAILLFKAGAPLLPTPNMWPLTFKPALGVPGEDGVWVSAAALRLWAVGPWAPAGDVVCSQPRALSSRLYPKTLPCLPEKSTPRRLLLAFPLKSFPWLVKRERNLHFKADKPLTLSAVPGSSQLLAEGSLFFFF